MMEDQGNETERLNPLARRVWKRLVQHFPDWSGYLAMCGEDDLEVAVPAPPGAYADHLVVLTDRGNIWVRYSPPRAFYEVEDEEELISIIEQLVQDQALFAVTMKGDKWAGTTLIRPGDTPELDPGQTVRIISWSGKNDRIISA